MKNIYLEFDAMRCSGKQHPTHSLFSNKNTQLY